MKYKRLQPGDIVVLTDENDWVNYPDLLKQLKKERRCHGPYIVCGYSKDPNLPGRVVVRPIRGRITQTFWRGWLKEMPFLQAVKDASR